MPVFQQKEELVPHLLLGLYVLAFSLGVVVVLFSAAGYRRLHVLSYKSFSLQFAGLVLILLGEGIRTYDQVTGGALSPAVHVVLACLGGSGNAILGWALPLFALHLTESEVTRRRLAVHGLLAAALSLFAIGKEVVPGLLTHTINYLALFGLYAYGCIILLKRFGNIEDVGLRRLTKRFLLLAGSLALPSIAEMAIKFFPGMPLSLRSYPYVQLVYFLASVGLLMEYVARPAEAGASAFNCPLPPDFILRYGITPRECDIIAMMEKGYSNRRLAEALFISAQTVKNHVYHIYQKTGAENKVQLINLVRTVGSGSGSRPLGSAGARIPAE